MRVQVGDCLFCTRTYLTLSAEVRCIFMSKDSELMPERPQTNEAIPDEAERLPCLLRQDRSRSAHASPYPG